MGRTPSQPTASARSNRGILEPVMDNFWVNALWSLAPTVLVGLIFWVIMRSIIRSDRDERAAYAKLEATERARLGLPPTAGSAPTGGSVDA
ncbi:hypothetical protein ACLRGF_15660 [Mycetocola zhadangensis]|uniref:hypothetical protein n=1 Tax=Mycetocola zhadangensis TaxID=1164595 RepID=UPI003A4DE6E4